MTPPDEFFEDYDKVRTHFEWAHQSMGGGNVDIPQARMVVAEWREFLQKWRQRIKDPDITKGLDAMAALMDKLDRTLEAAHLEQLQAVLQARRDWFISEQLLKASVSFAELIKTCSPELLPELKKIHSDTMGQEYDAATDYRETEADAEEAEARFRKALAKLETDWPERADATLRQRLMQIDIDALNAWEKEVAEAIAAQQQHLRSLTVPE